MGPETLPVDNCSVLLLTHLSHIGEKGAEVEFSCPAPSRLHILIFYCFKRSVLPPDRRRVSHTASADETAGCKCEEEETRLLPSEHQLLLRSSGDSFPAPSGSTPGVSTWLLNSYFSRNVIAPFN